VTAVDDPPGGFDFDDEDAPPHTDEDAPWDPTDVFALPPPAAYKLNGHNPPTADDTDGRSSWWPVDLSGLFDGSVVLPEPELFARNDGQALLYPGKCHSFNGESESGKSWAALLACVQAIRAGGHVLYLDFEDTASTVVTRLLALGAKPEEVVGRFHYASPSEPLQYRNGKVTVGHLDLGATLETHPITLAVIDGVTEAMTLHGLATNDNDEYAKFHAMLPRRLSRAGTAVVNIDHVTKDKETRGRYAIGAQHKLAGMDGAVFSFEVVSPFGLGLHGIAKMYVNKDRPGQLRTHAESNGGRHLIAELHLRSDPATHALAASIDAPAAGAGIASDTTPTWWMEQISRAVEADGPLTSRQIEELRKPDGSAGSTPAKRKARDLLNGAYLRPERQGQTIYYHHVKPYREASEDHEDS